MPDQLSRMHALGANWQAAEWQLGYSLNFSTQDNRQVGRESADFENLGHNLTGGYRFSQNLNVTAGFGRTANYANETALKSFTYNYSGGFDWQFRETWGLNGNYSRNSGRDSRNFAESRGWSAQTQVSRRFTTQPFGVERKLPGQVFLRHVLSDNYNKDNVFGLLTAGRFWMLQTGVTVSFF